FLQNQLSTLPIVEGDLVLVKLNPYQLSNGMAKLKLKWSLPCRVLQKLSSSRFLIKAILDKKTAEVHISDLQKIDRPRGHIQYSEWLQILEEELKLRDPELTVDDSILQAREALDTLLNG